MFRNENASLRRENARLKKVREAGDTAKNLCQQNDQLRSELGKLLNLHKDSNFVSSGVTRGRQLNPVY